jgi:microcystin-dependent protein
MTGSTATGGGHTHTMTGSTAVGGGHAHTMSGSTALEGSGTAFSNLAPYIVVNYIIKL